MTDVIWTLVVGFDGVFLDSGPGHDAQKLLDSGAARVKVERQRMGESWETRADKNRAHMRNMRLTGMMERTNRNHIQSSAQAQAGAGLAMAAMQTQNHYTADQAEDRALAQLEPSVLAIMPQSSGGVLVNSAFRQQGSARTHVSAYVIGAFQTPSIGVESYRKKIEKSGSMADQNAVFRMYWATIVRQMRPAHSGPPVMTSWP